MHIDSYVIGHVAHARKAVSFSDLRHGYSHDDLLLQLDIESFIAVKINCYIHDEPPVSGPLLFYYKYNS